MQYSQEEKRQIAQELIDYCEKLGFGEITVEIINGAPVNVVRGVQRIRLDKGLTNYPGNATME